MTWSPSDRFLAFSTHSELIVIDRSGREIATYSSDKIDIIQNLAWAPSESFIAFHAATSESRNIFLFHLKDELLQPLLTKPVINETCPIFSPNGSKLLFSEGIRGGQNLKTFNFETQEIVDLEISWASTAASCPPPVYWLKSESHLIFRGYNHLLLMMNANAPDDIKVIAECAGGFNWSADNQKIIYSGLRSDECGEFMNANHDIFVFDVETGQISNLTNTPNIDERRPSWLPSETQITFTVAKQDKKLRSIYMMNSNGTGRKKLAGGAYMPQLQYHWPR